MSRATPIARRAEAATRGALHAEGRDPGRVRSAPDRDRAARHEDRADPPHPDFRLEIQIRTALQHAWAEVEHDLGYKAQDAVPELIRRRFNRIASLLEIADQEFVSIRRELLHYQAAVRAELVQGQSLPLDAVSLDSPAAAFRTAPF